MNAVFCKAFDAQNLSSELIALHQHISCFSNPSRNVKTWNPPQPQTKQEPIAQEEAEDMELVTWAAVYPKKSEPVTHYYHAHQEKGSWLQL